MAKKAKKARKGKKPNYSQGWETRRRNAANAAAARSALGGSTASATTAWKAPKGYVQERVNEMVEQAQADGEKSFFAPDQAPGHGEIVGGADAQLAERIVKLSRRKGGTDAVQSEIMALRATAKYEGSVETDTNATKRLVEVQQILSDRIVCGFIAEVDHAVKYHRGLPPGMTWVLSSLTVVKVIDALNRAGYSAAGRSDKAVGN